MSHALYRYNYKIQYQIFYHLIRAFYLPKDEGVPGSDQPKFARIITTILYLKKHEFDIKDTAFGGFKL